MANIYDLSDTWNDGGTTFNAIKMNVTNTASASGSLLMDLQVGGSSKFKVTKIGDTFCRASTADITSAVGIGCRISSSGTISIGGTTGHIQFTPTNNFASTPDLFIFRDAANTLAQRNSTNAQTFNLYNTYTDASNYERGFMKWNSNVIEIGNEAAGTGLLRSGRFVFSSVVFGTGSVGTNHARWDQNYGFEVISPRQFSWAPSTDATANPDTGLARSAAGVVKVTDGSTGTGELIFIVPTSDPGITGALWNNGGTLAISA